MSKELVQRLIAGILGSAFIVTMVTYGLLTFSIVCFILLFLLLGEFYSITKQFRPTTIAGMLFGVSCVGLTVLYQFGLLTNFKLLLLPLSLLSLVPLMVLFQKDRHSIHSISVTFMGFFYIVFPLCLFLLMSKLTPGSNYNWQVILGVFLIIWSNDTGAYFAGKTMGKTKLFERISPNKTIEGSVGGVILALLIIWLFNYLFPSEHMSFVHWASLVIVVSACGILGDLVESQIKRTLAIKDSGSIIPGHGGFLDRFDALIFAIPFAFICHLLFS